MTLKLSKRRVFEAAKFRPPGYLEDVLADPAKVVGEYIVMPIHRYSALKERYKLVKPSFFQKLRGFLTEMIKWRQAGYRITPHRIFFERNKACAKCPYSAGKWIKTCGRCGCTRAKLWLETARCPEGRWKQ